MSYILSFLSDATSFVTGMATEVVRLPLSGMTAQETTRITQIALPKFPFLTADGRILKKVSLFARNTFSDGSDASSKVSLTENSLFERALSVPEVEQRRQLLNGLEGAKKELNEILKNPASEESVLRLHLLQQNLKGFKEIIRNCPQLGLNQEIAQFETSLGRVFNRVIKREDQIAKGENLGGVRHRLSDYSRHPENLKKIESEFFGTNRRQLVTDLIRLMAHAMYETSYNEGQASRAILTKILPLLPNTPKLYAQIRKDPLFNTLATTYEAHYAQPASKRIDKLESLTAEVASVQKEFMLMLDRNRELMSALSERYKEEPLFKAIAQNLSELEEIETMFRTELYSILADEKDMIKRIALISQLYSAENIRRYTDLLTRLTKSETSYLKRSELVKLAMESPERAILLKEGGGLVDDVRTISTQRITRLNDQLMAIRKQLAPLQANPAQKERLKALQKQISENQQFGLNTEAEKLQTQFNAVLAEVEDETLRRLDRSLSEISAAAKKVNASSQVEAILHSAALPQTDKREDALATVPSSPEIPAVQELTERESVNARLQNNNIDAELIECIAKKPELTDLKPLVVARVKANLLALVNNPHASAEERNALIPLGLHILESRDYSSTPGREHIYSLLKKRGLIPPALLKDEYLEMVEKGRFEEASSWVSSLGRHEVSFSHFIVGALLKKDYVDVRLIECVARHPELTDLKPEVVAKVQGKLLTLFRSPSVSTEERAALIGLGLHILGSRDYAATPAREHIFNLLKKRGLIPAAGLSQEYLERIERGQCELASVWACGPGRHEIQYSKPVIAALLEKEYMDARLIENIGNRPELAGFKPIVVAKVQAKLLALFRSSMASAEERGLMISLGLYILGSEDYASTPNREHIYSLLKKRRLIPNRL